MTVHYLKPKSKVFILFQSKASGGTLFEQVCKQLNLLETDYFGLEYNDNRGATVSEVYLYQGKRRVLIFKTHSSLLLWRKHQSRNCLQTTNCYKVVVMSTSGLKFRWGKGYLRTQNTSVFLFPSSRDQNSYRMI